MQGACNGNTNTVPEKIPESVVRVKGGRLYTGSSYSLGRNKPGYSTYPMSSKPRLEVQGGELYVYNQLVNGDDQGAHSMIEVTGGKVTVRKETIVGRCSGSADTTNTLVVTGAGTLSTTALINHKTSCWNVAVTNGGTVTATGTSSNENGVVNFFVSRGGTLSVKPFLTYKGTTNIRVEDGGTFSVTKLQNANGLARYQARRDEPGVHLRQDVWIAAELEPEREYPERQELSRGQAQRFGLVFVHRARDGRLRPRILRGAAQWARGGPSGRDDRHERRRCTLATR